MLPKYVEDLLEQEEKMSRLLLSDVVELRRWQSAKCCQNSEVFTEIVIASRTGFKM